MSHSMPLQRSLLTIRLSIPPTRPRLVLRPRLLKRLDEGMCHKCTLICAPAGFGKTTLLAAWTMRRKQLSGQTVGWLSLDDGDNDPQRFWSYFVAVLQRVQPDIGREILPLLRSGQPLPTETLLVLLANELAALSQEVALVLDDYHVIDTPALHHALGFLLDHLPVHVHLFISSRGDPPLPLARLRARNELVELHAAELCFTGEEAAVFLRDTMDLALPEQAVAALEARTEGWIAGLQLAALALKGQTDVSGFLTAFTISSSPHRHIADYLVEEVLEQQPEPVRTFLLRTCILDRLNSPLCQALSEMTNAQEMLRLLEQRNVFLVPLDEQRLWYRYHQLFAEVLRNYVRETMPEQLLELHRKASDCYERQGYSAEAIGHALAAMEMERAATLIERLMEATHWQYSEYATLRRWLQALPEAVIQARPQLCVLYTLPAVLASPFDPALLDRAEGYLRHAQRFLAIDEQSVALPQDGQIRPMQGEIAAGLSILLRIKGEIGVARQYAHQALALVPYENIIMRYQAANTLTTLYMNYGDIEAANWALEELTRLSRTTQDTIVAMSALTSMAVMQTLQGRLHQAFAAYQEIIRRAQQRLKHWHPIWSYMGLGGILLEWNRIDEAELYLTRSLEYARETDHLDGMFNSYDSLLFLYCARGDISRAFACIDEIESLLARGPRSSQALFSGMCNALRAWLALTNGDLEAAKRWAQRYRYADDIDETPLSSIRIEELIILTQVYLAQNRLSAALQLSAQLLPLAERMQRTPHIIRVRVLQARIFAAQGDMPGAVAALACALELAEPGGYIRIFVNEGAPMAALLAQVLDMLQSADPALTQPVSVAYVQELLAALEQRMPTIGQMDNTDHSQEKSQLLSKRECEVVHLMSLGLSDREIAQRLVLTENTVKTHAKRIYSRLNVKNRAEAVTRARELHLF